MGNDGPASIGLEHFQKWLLGRKLAVGMLLHA